MGAPTTTRRARRAPLRAERREPAPERLLDLPPVELGPPTGPTGRPSSLAGRAALTVALLAGVFVLAAAVVLGLVLANVLAWRAGRVIGALVVATLAVAAALGRAMVSLVRRPPADPLEVEVGESDDPQLWTQVRALAEEVGTRPPDRIVVIAEVNAYVHEQGALLGLLRGRRTLAIGVPLLDVLTVSELRAVLAHEMGHFAGGDTRLGPLAFRTEQALATVVQSLGNRATTGIFIAYWKLQRRISSTVRRGQELTADRAAVAVAGRQAAADALQVIGAAAAAHGSYVDAYVVPLLRRAHRPDDLADGFRRFLDGHREALIAVASSQLEADAAGDPYASHPPTAERIRRVAALPETSVPEPDERSARAWFAEPDRWEAAAYDRWVTALTGGAALTEAGWDAFGTVVAEPDALASAADVDRVLTGLGRDSDLAGLRSALEAGQGREVAAGLVSAGWRGPNEDLLRAAVHACAVREALDRGGATWVTSWSGPLKLRAASGAVMELGAPVDAAVAGDWEPLAAVVADLTRRRRRPGAACPTSPPAAPEAALSDPAHRPGTVEQWSARLPGRLGTKVTIGTTPSGLVLGDTEVPFGSIAHASVSLGAPSDQGLNVTYAVETDDGRTVKVRTSTVGRKGADPLLEAADRIWGALRVAVSPRLREALVAAVLAGQPTEVGGLQLTRDGAAPAKKPGRVTPWAHVLDPVVQDRHVVMSSSRPVLRTPLAARDAVVLMDLLPELRAHLAA